MKTLAEKWTMEEMATLADTVAKERKLRVDRRSACWIQLHKEKGKHENAEFDFSRFGNGMMTVEFRGKKMSKLPATGDAWVEEKKRLKEFYAKN